MPLSKVVISKLLKLILDLSNFSQFNDNFFHFLYQNLSSLPKSNFPKQKQSENTVHALFSNM